MPRVHTFSSFYSAEVWTFQKLARSLKCRYGLTLQMPLVKCFLRRSWISNLGFTFLLLRLYSLVLSSLLNLRFFPAEGGESSLYRARGKSSWYIKVFCAQRLLFVSTNSASWLDFLRKNCFFWRVNIHEMAALCYLLISACATGLYSISDRMIVFSLRKRVQDAVKSA